MAVGMAVSMTDQYVIADALRRARAIPAQVLPDEEVRLMFFHQH